MATFVGAAGRDTLTGGAENDLLQGLGGDDVLEGHGGDDLLEGGEGDDYLAGGSVESLYNPAPGGRDTLRGGLGDDTISSDIFDAEVSGGEGADLILVARPYELWDLAPVLSSVDAGGGDDRVWVGGFNASDRIVLLGGAGTNTLVLRDWRLPEIRLNQSYEGPGVLALDFHVVEWDQTWARVHGGGLNERFNAHYGSDWIDAGGGDDVIFADAAGWHAYGDDTVYGGTGADQITDYGGSNFLWGGAGNDRIQGGKDFDNTHGNEGDDTVSGGAGDDWVVGGKDQDVLYGEAGGDVVYGNMGFDTLWGGDGNDVVRGGQADDLVHGEAGDDWISGDRGNDTVVGGAGADSFHTFVGAGLDRVTDFNAAEGDRVYLLAGTQYSVRQAGADTIVDLGNGDELILVGVTASSLPTGWIFGA